MAEAVRPAGSHLRPVLCPLVRRTFGEGRSAREEIAMAHDCPNCGELCKCDGSEIIQPAPAACFCKCREFEEDDFDDEDDDLEGDLDDLDDEDDDDFDDEAEAGQ
jgi:hypothetical protein